MSLWRRICDVEVGPLVAWLPWAVWQATPNGIARCWDVPADLSWPVVTTVCEALKAGKCLRQELCLNRIGPGFAYPVHVDNARFAGWLTRVHVPLVTNPGAWHLFESE